MRVVKKAKTSEYYYKKSKSGPLDEYQRATKGKNTV